MVGICPQTRTRRLTVDFLLKFLEGYGALGAVLAILVTNVLGLFWLLSNGTVEFGSRRRAEVSFLMDQIRITKEGYEQRLSEMRQDITDLTNDRDDWRERAWKAITAGQTIAQGQTPPKGIHRSELGG